jgi:hypothetical protein
VISARAREESITTFTALILAGNHKMIDVLNSLGPVRIVDGRMTAGRCQCAQIRSAIAGRVELDRAEASTSHAWFVSFAERLANVAGSRRSCRERSQRPRRGVRSLEIDAQLEGANQAVRARVLRFRRTSELPRCPIQLAQGARCALAPDALPGGRRERNAVLPPGPATPPTGRRGDSRRESS